MMCWFVESLYTANYKLIRFFFYTSPLMPIPVGCVWYTVVRKAHSWEALPPKASIKNSTNQQCCHPS